MAKASTRGPIGKRTGTHLGHRTKAQDAAADTAPGAPEVVMPEPDEKWHEIARDWYLSLAQSGESAFYEPSDWATARVVAESLSRDLKPKPYAVNEETGLPMMVRQPISGSSLSAYLKAFGLLLVTEGDRRRMSVELNRPRTGNESGGENDDNVTDIADYLTTG